MFDIAACSTENAKHANNIQNCEARYPSAWVFPLITINRQKNMAMCQG
jgi:hypothetical protein